MRSEIHDIRYFFEHQLLPRAFFEDRALLITVLVKEKDFLYKMVQEVFEKEGAECPYRPEEFRAEPLKISKDVLLLKLTYPEPESEPLCYGSYLLFDTAFENPAFFCLERGARRDEMPFLCRWDESGNHLNYGRCSTEHGEALARCLELYLGLESGSGGLKVKPS